MKKNLNNEEKMIIENYVMGNDGFLALESESGENDFTADTEIPIIDMDFCEEMKSDEVDMMCSIFDKQQKDNFYDFSNSFDEFD